MNHRKAVHILAVTAALAPAICGATPERAALKACASALASSLASPGSAAPAFTVDYRRSYSTGSMLEFYAREFTFELRAHDSKTGLTVARARCSTDSRGAVVALSSIPLKAAPAALAAKL